MMGEKELEVDEDIHINNIVLKGTPGLWRLIMTDNFFPGDNNRLMK